MALIRSKIFSSLLAQQTNKKNALGKKTRPADLSGMLKQRLRANEGSQLKRVDLK